MMRILAIGLLSAVVGFVLTQLGFSGKRAFGALAFVIIIASVSSGLGEIIGTVSDFARLGDVSEGAAVALKIVFVGYLFGICSDIASELSESAVASALAVAGKVETVLLILPYLSEVVSRAAEIVG